MKTGDKLYCKKTYYSNPMSDINREEWVTKGKSYKVIYEDILGVFSIIDNDGDHNNTMLTDMFFKKYFLTEKEYRTKKLQKLKKLYDSK